MSDTVKDNEKDTVQRIPFKAETRQLLDILIHSLYTEREIFVRELVSNASDALTRLNFEILTNREVAGQDSELAIWILPDEENKTLTIRDNGIGMSAQELAENLGTIAHSGARAFMAASKENGKNITEIIGQFGVGFYSAFMAAEWIRVVSKSFQPDVPAAAWFSSGDDTFTVEAAEKSGRGTEVILKLKEDAEEFLKEYRLREIIRRHSDFVPFPIYIGEGTEQANRQTAIWRQGARQVKAEEYEEFYKQLTLDFEAPLTYTHLAVDAPVQMYAVLFVPAKQERGMLGLRREDGLKLYARKVLIQEYNKDLLPEYYRFVQGVVDSEDLPLNVSRETVQSNRVMSQLKKLVTSKTTEMLKKLAKEQPEKYEAFWMEFGRHIKDGVAVEQNDAESLYPLLRFRTTQQAGQWSSLAQYVERMKPGQEAIYYILGDDERSVLFSPHLDLVKEHDYEVLLLTDAIDAFMLMRLNEFDEKPLVNVANADLQKPEAKGDEAEASEPAVGEADFAALVERFKQKLGERVADVRATDKLAGSPARLIDPPGAMNPEMQRVYRLLKEDYETPKKVLELNPRHTILKRLSTLPAGSALGEAVMEQVFENALLLEGLHPDPVGMIPRLQKIMEEALLADRG